MRLSAEAFDERARALRLLLFDVDGVLTDGGLAFSAEGVESKRFFVRDGAAVIWAQKHGLPVGLLSGRSSAVTTRRARELRIDPDLVSQDSPDKLPAFSRLLEQSGVTEAQVGYMGDDILDLPVLSRVGLAAAPADAVDEVRERVHWVSEFPGGHGAARQFVERILRARGHWDDVVGRYLG